MSTETDKPTLTFADKWLKHTFEMFTELAAVESPESRLDIVIETARNPNPVLQKHTQGNLIRLNLSPIATEGTLQLHATHLSFSIRFNGMLTDVEVKYVEIMLVIINDIHYHYGELVSNSATGYRFKRIDHLCAAASEPTTPAWEKPRKPNPFSVVK